MEVYDEVKSVFVDICNLDEANLHPTTNMVTDVTIDSIDFMDATYEIDQRFGIKLPFEDWATAINAGDEGATERFTLQGICDQVEILRAQASTVSGHESDKGES